MPANQRSQNQSIPIQDQSHLNIDVKRTNTELLSQIKNFTFSNLISLQIINDQAANTLYFLSENQRLKLQRLAFRQCLISKNILQLVSKMENLNILQIVKCYLVQFPVIPNKKLRTLKIAASKVNRVNSDLQHLQHLQIVSNQLKNVRCLMEWNLKNVLNIQFSNNLIQDPSAIFLAELPRLNKLNLDQNQICDISALQYSQLNQLQDLYLSYNKIVNIQVLKRVTLPSLKVLDLQNNSLADISCVGRIQLPTLKNFSLRSEYHPCCEPILKFKKSANKTLFNLQYICLDHAIRESMITFIRSTGNLLMYIG